MLLKKQTVWLLTMLALVVVLSAYYLVSPEQKSDMAGKQEADMKKEAAQEKGEGSEVAITSGDDDFTALRLEIEEERSRMSEEYETAMADSEMSSEDINKAYEALEEISEARVTENILESSIASELELDAALVRIDGKNVNVTVKADELSKEKANEIIMIVSNEMTDAQDVVVEHLPEK